MKTDAERVDPSQSRRISRRKWLIGLGACVVGGGVATVASDDRWDLRVTRVTVKLRRLRPGLDGLTIAHLTDLHRGRYIPESFIRRAVDAAGAAAADLIVLTGDYVTHRADFMTSCARPLARLSAPFGKLAVLGNHEYWTDADVVAQKLTDTAGFRVLKNRSVLIARGGADLAIAGLDDPVTAHHDFDRTLAQVAPETPVVMLAHAPDVAKEAARRKIGLVLAGHTHGGQISIPGIGPPIVPSRLPRRFASGLNMMDETAIYTNRGIGMAVLPVRLNCPPEVALITLRCATPA